MKTKRFRILLAVLLVAVAGWLAWGVLRPREPMYKGKPLSYWLEGYYPRDGVTPQQADEAVRHIGTNAIPKLLELLRAKDPALTSKAFRLAVKQHFMKIPYIPDWGRDLQAMSAFGVLGAEAKEAVPALVEIYHRNFSEASRDATVYALAKIGTASNQGVLPLLQAMNTDPSLRLAYIQALFEFEPREIATVLPSLIMCMQDSNSQVRGRAFEVLGSLWPDVKAVVPAMMLLLDDSNLSLRMAATNALKRIDPEAAAKAGVK